MQESLPRPVSCWKLALLHLMHRGGELSEIRRNILCDTLTSGGLPLAVAPGADPEAELTAPSRAFGLDLRPVRSLTERRGSPVVEVV